jgi:hypothetical protein
MAHGFSAFEAAVQRGRRVVTCECGWRSHPDWAKGQRWQAQIEALRRHVIGTWKAA